MCLFPLVRRANFSFHGAFLDFWPLGHRPIVGEMMFFFWFREIWEREEEKSIYRSLGHRPPLGVSAPHNAQRTLHDGGAGEYGKCTAVQYNGGEK